MSISAAPYTRAMYEFIASALKEIGPRESCSPSERQLGQRLVDQWRARGMHAQLEPFVCHPQAFLGFIPYAALFYLMATIFYWLAPPFAAVFAAMALIVTILELILYREFVDPLFPQAEGHNAVGTITPRGEVRRRVVLSAHLDSAYEFNLWFFFKNAGIPVMVVAFCAPLVPFFGGLLKTLLAESYDPALFDTIGYICLALYPIVGLNFFFHTYSTVPGAMDDLAGVAVLDGVAQALDDSRSKLGSAALEHTEVILLGASSEEAGLRGAKRFVAAHAAKLKALPSYGIFVDGIYDERHLTVVPRELSTGAKHDPRLVALARSVAAARGWNMLARVIPFGATDATTFAVNGIPSVCLLCQDTAHLAPNYHTRLDTLDHVRPESLTVTLQVVLDMLERIDAGEIESSPRA